MLETRPCSTNGCAKIASKLECPKCKQDPNLPSSFFCSQSCFKTAWPQHKLSYHSNIPPPVIPQEYKGPSQTFDPFDEHNISSYPLRNPSKETLRGIQHFKYTGPLRACYPIQHVSKRTVPDSIPLRKQPSTITNFITFTYYLVQNGFSLSEQAIAGQRLGKPLKPHEIEGMRKVCKLAREVLDLAAAHVKPGITSLELDKIIHDACIERNSYPSPLGYFLFPRSVCISVNEVICHGIPDARPLEEGDIVNLDVTLFHEGFHGDLNATYPVGKISEESEHLIKSTRRCLDRAISICRPGTLFREIGNIIEPMAKQAGLNVNKRYCGHGISQLFHGPPNIPHYAKSKAIGEMKPGMVCHWVFTIEPMVNQGVSDEDHWPDNWTAVTRDGKRSAQFEETLLITDNGVEVLTAQPGWKLPAEFEEVALGLVSASQS
ncbi:methionine aminopeptidase, type I [Puccinia sorghi]|uniref:Methionine aminopeptidase n=1 Tax=Puccinia sorghi TaxID=27349 RepID=A0A0L6UWR6_9BASI|nr:methionine aminopeptidase, type I [Puccinia sorghi]